MKIIVINNDKEALCSFQTDVEPKEGDIVMVNNEEREIIDVKTIYTPTTNKATVDYEVRVISRRF